LNAAITNSTKYSKRTVERIATLRKRFAHDELEMFRRKNLAQQKVEEISRIVNEKKRQRIIGLIASGMEFTKAWKKVMKQDIDLSTTTKAEKVERAKAREEKVPELTDDEWFDQQCGAKSARLGDPTKFKQAALLFRRTADARAKFRASIKESLSEAEAHGDFDNSLWASLHFVFSLSHPRDWPICSACKGSGKDARGRACAKCRGNCIELQTENHV
jgi:hypothetical protein